MRFPRSASIVLLLALALVGLTVAGCGTGSGVEVPLRQAYSEGDSWTYEATMVMNGSVSAPGMAGAEEQAIPADTTIKMRETITVDHVFEGIATLTAEVEILGATAGGQSIDLGAQGVQKMTMQVDETGKVLSIEGPDGADALNGMLGSAMPFDPSQLSNQMSVLLPPDGVGRVGEEWSDTFSFPIPGMGEDVKATVKGKLVAVGTENGRELATIDYTMEIPLDLELDLGALMRQMSEGMGAEAGFGDDLAFKMTMKGRFLFTGTAKVDTADGQTAAMNGVFDMEMQMEITEAPGGMIPDSERGPFSIDMNFTMDMVQK